MKLEDVVNKALIDGLSDGMKYAIDRLHARGLSRLSILTFVDGCIKKAAGGDPCKGQLTRQAVEAYLDSKGVS